MPIRFRDGPPTGDDLPHLQLIRLPASGQLKIAITSHAILHVDTHYVGRRTVPCVSENCQGCLEEKPKRYEGYLSGWTGKPGKHILLALTAGASRGLILAVPTNADLRGRIVYFSRNGKRPNGMLKAELLEEMMSPDALPPAPDVLAHMLKIWGLDANHIAMDAPAYASQVRATGTNGQPQNHAHIPGK